MGLTVDVKKSIIIDWAGNESLSGSTEAQIGLLTARISQITKHMSLNKHDVMSKRGLLKLISTRRKLLKYLERRNATLAAQILQKIKAYASTS